MSHEQPKILACSCGQRMRLPAAPEGKWFKCVACGKVMRYQAPPDALGAEQALPPSPNPAASTSPAEPSNQYIQGVRETIERNWPVLARYRWRELSFFRMFALGLVEGFCWFEKPAQKWLHSRGGSVFAADECVPEHYVAYGLQGRGGSEYLFLFMREGERRFAFFDQYVIYVSPSAASAEETAQRLEDALARWDRGDTIVVFSGPWGWFDPKTQAYDLDRDEIPGDMGEIVRLLSNHGKNEIEDIKNKDALAE